MKNQILKIVQLALIVSIVFISVNCNNQGDQQTDSTSIISQNENELSDNFFKIDTPQDGSEIRGTISVQGRHDIPANTKVWILLHDGFGYYLQNPPAIVLPNKTWKQDNTIANGGVKAIMVASVGDTGHERFSQMVTDGMFGQFTELPDDLTFLDAVSVINPK
ncbi:MAG: hypothetical protein GYB31_20125 [Bacteroidetes bacterium]|nr:hypothetical protein [Bacteroidota bacterium]